MSRKNNLPRLLFFEKKGAKVLDVIIHGSSHGIESSFIQKVFESCKDEGNSVIAFNFPYLERGEENSSGPELKEELETLETMLSIAKSKEYSRIRLIGKSLGGIVSSYYLNSIEKERKLYEVVILGYVTGEVKLRGFGGKITIIQGEKDKFGNIEVVKEDLKGGISEDITYLEISGADHNYRDPGTKEPIYEDLAIEKLVSAT